MHLKIHIYFSFLLFILRSSHNTDTTTIPPMASCQSAGPVIFPARNTLVGPSAPPMTDIAEAAFESITDRKIRIPHPKCHIVNSPARTVNGITICLFPMFFFHKITPVINTTSGTNIFIQYPIPKLTTYSPTAILFLCVYHTFIPYVCL